MLNPLIEGEDYYFLDDGRMVFMAKYLLERGFCCGKACKHCPYDFKNVEEPVRSRLLAIKNSNEQD